MDKDVSESIEEGKNPEEAFKKLHKKKHHKESSSDEEKNESDEEDEERKKYKKKKGKHTGKIEAPVPQAVVHEKKAHPKADILIKE